ncbi:zinc-binding dehydrogenase [Streptantibioticus cattleyicolor]|uniref:Oxidoreductase n=1 Tax=Streptantibioticus cattleyicolor (strain ATCC 35852 / DSM 46488 / JCM 4925 / NBRC 14057 / NRRL 8057) TaxID=1003195 RepID=F8JKG5_STREN|nr:zinc-binding dehydrogenase [Streptantibioticus cattleyicolor]AEW99769.1 oxidoreductase [Streptantibioticus cattleyicolor NRRL 8057 = DSM 46488]CCB71194.1 Monooxygenase [Streptantibioticus cattleyicolor NRRL 8057 = DSM 46488]
MKAVVIRAFGDPDGLEVVDVAVPVPAPGQVRITTEAIGVGGVDAVIRRGTLAAHGFQEGHLLGSEVAGRVTAVGEGVDASWVGRRVWAFTGLSGGYAEQAVAGVGDVLPLPDGLTGAAAVTLGGSGVVAHFALERARFTPGESVLVRGAAGSIGITAVQLAAAGGAGAVAVTTSSAERGARLRDLGATHVLDRSGAGGPDAPAGFDVVLDVVSGPQLPSFLGRLNPNGRYMAVGVVGGQPPADFGMRLMDAFRSSLSFATFSADTVPGPGRQAVRASQFADAAHGRLRTVVHGTLPLDQAASAHRAMDAGQVFGRAVLVP